MYTKLKCQARCLKIRDENLGALSVDSDDVVKYSISISTPIAHYLLVCCMSLLDPEFSLHMNSIFSDNLI